MLPFQLSELKRRLCNMIQVGQIHEVDTQKALAKVRLGDIITHWLPWVAGRAGSVRHWSPLEANEQVVVLAPFGELNQGIILGSLYQNTAPAPDTQAQRHTIAWDDGLKIKYDQTNHKLNIQNAETLNITVSGQANIQAKDITLEASETQSIMAKGPLQLASGECIELSAPNISLASQGGGQCSMQGSFAIDGDVHVTGDLLNEGANSNHHSH